MNKSISRKGDYGIDAPPVIRNLLLAGIANAGVAQAESTHATGGGDGETRDRTCGGRDDQSSLHIP